MDKTSNAGRMKKQSAREKHQPSGASSARMSLLKWLLPVMAVTFLCYTSLLSDKKEFTNWDDPGYVLEQPLVKEYNADKRRILWDPSTDVMLNYHPITMMTLAWNYKQGFDKKTNTLDVTPFAITNLMIHLANTLLVFLFIWSLTGGKWWASGLTALLFGIHPMHVESVAWISERKDVLYCFFFLLSCLAYLRFTEGSKWLWLGISFLLFALSCLSKAMAVPLPLVLILIDVFRQRQFNFRVIAEKIPFLLLALWFGYNAVQIQDRGALAEFEVFTLGQRIMFASYGFIMYVVKLFAPFGLSAFYPYPALDEHGTIPALYYLAPLLASALLTIPLIYLRKKNPEWFRVVLLGSGFYSLMVALVLQFISVGQAIMADRYTYVPYIGLFFIAGMGFEKILVSRRRNLALGAVAGFALLCGWLTHSRVQIWHNSGVLWTDVIDQYPFLIEQDGNVVKVKKRGFETAYKNRGNWYADRQLYDSAFADYDVLARAATKDAGVWSNLGNVYALKGDISKALDAYSKAIQYNPGNLQTYLNRGLTYSNLGRNAEALADMESALKLSPGSEQAFTLKARSLLNLGKYPETIRLCEQLLLTFPQNAELYFFKGTALLNVSKPAEGITEINKAIQLNPDNGSYHYNLAFGYVATGNKEAARNAVARAEKLGIKPDPGFLEKLK
ncbi:MAG: tetratricopeptide repeat protein [Bacteroidia bacterium]|nr:tetratricopeptide repeat protein [Bacteroidia bacterium]